MPAVEAVAPTRVPVVPVAQAAVVQVKMPRAARAITGLLASVEAAVEPVGFQQAPQTVATVVLV
jgi:hypothetical protein